MGHAVEAGWCWGGTLLLWSPQAQGGSAQMSGFMVHMVFGGPPSGQTRPWKAKHCWPGHEVLPRWRRDTVVVCGCCRAGGNPFARMGWARGAQHPGVGWERPNVFSVSFTSLARFQKSVRSPLLWWSRCPSPQGSPGEELLKSNLTVTQDGQCQVWGGIRCQDQNAAVRGGSGSSPPAPAIRGPGASPAGDGVSMRAPGGFSFLRICPVIFSTQTTMKS